jgi:hypothetical protein
MVGNVVVVPRTLEQNYGRLALPHYGYVLFKFWQSTASAPRRNLFPPFNSLTI